MSRPLTTGTYTPTPVFQSIPEHAAVCFADDGMLIALTGPAIDQESQDYARLFAAAPDLLAALEEILRLSDANTQKSSDLVVIRAYAIDLARESIRKARGEG